MGIKFEVPQVTDFGGYLGAEASRTLPYIEQIAREEGLSNRGFDGMLKPLGDFFQGEPSVLVGDAFTHMQRGMCYLGDALIEVATVYIGTENQNTKLLEKLHLDKDTGEETTFGKYDKRYDPHVTEGESLSQYKVTDLANKHFDRSDPGYYDKANNRSGPLLVVLNEIWANWPCSGGNFVDQMVAPLAGNSNSVRANGQAWRNVGENVGLLAGNMAKNVGILVGNFWQGPAADGFSQFLDKYFTKTIAVAGDAVGRFIEGGFNELAETVDAVAKEVVRAIDKICGIAEKHLLKLTPYVGWIVGLVLEVGDAAVDLINLIPGVEIPDPGSIRDAIGEIITLAEDINRAYDELQQTVENAREYVEIANEFKNTIVEFQGAVENVLGSVGQIDSMDDVPGVFQQASEQFGEIQEKLGELQEKVEHR